MGVDTIAATIIMSTARNRDARRGEGIKKCVAVMLNCAPQAGPAALFILIIDACVS